MCVQNVPFKMREEGRKRALKREIDFYDVLGLDVGFVPVCAPERPLTVRCPMCDLVMLHNGTEYFCPDCGIRG